jgi:dTDP-4-dehydrorhamnose reductase
MPRRWLITGATGLLADDLVAACRLNGEVVTTARSGGDHPCDLRDRDAVKSLIADVSPDVIVHAAALTDVDYCERMPKEAVAVNRDTATHIAAALPQEAQFVFVSTDQVYPDTMGPHGESGIGPINVYGQSKLAGEERSLEHPNALVLRTNFFGRSRRPGRVSLSDFVIDALTAGNPITLFDDIRFSPLHMTTFAALVVELVDRRITGLFNAGCREGASKAQFGLAVAKHKGLQTQTARVGTSDVMHSRAPRPKDMRMSLDRLEAALGRAMPTLAEEIGKL